MRYLFILNPAAGKQDCTVQLIPQLQQAAVRAGIPVDAVATCKTEYAGHAKALARAAAEEAAKAGEQLHIWTAGGDGTLVEALTGVQGFANAAVGCLPYGSGTMQTNLGLSATICAAGLDAQVAYGIPKFRRIPLCGGEMAYALSIVEQLCGQIGRKIEYDIDGEKLTVDCLMCAICNGKAYGGGFLAAPEAVPDDGWMDVVIIRKVGRLTIAKLLGMYKRGGHFVHGQLTEQAKPYFIYRRAKQVTLRPVDGRGPIVATADGECAPCDRVEIALRPQSARILLPKAAYERFCAQRQNAASAGTR
mgnify:CR=1 FL=1